jgi:hypothetical protein
MMRPMRRPVRIGALVCGGAGARLAVSAGGRVEIACANPFARFDPT